MTQADAAAATPLVLASGSPRRRQLLDQAGYTFSVVPSGIDEQVADGEDPLVATARLALAKAAAVITLVAPGAAVLSADTSVVCAGRMFGKPSSENEAVQFLLDLAGRNHDVVTAWAVRRDAGSKEECLSGLSRSVVRLREISRREAEAYAASGEPMDKAGGYAVQGEGRCFVAAVLGELDNVIGLPLGQIKRALAAVGVVPT